jgi:glycerol-3-phosphate dehydrogenase (NAD(P)+)
MALKTITVLGDGAWGTTLAIHLANKKYPVTLWGPFADNVIATAKARENKKFLPGYKLPKNIQLSSDIHAAIGSAELIVLASPSEFLEDTVAKVKKTDYKNKVFVSVVKGIHPVSFKRMSQIIKEYLPGIDLAILSGPTIAWEVAAGVPTTAVVACPKIKLAKDLQTIFNSPTFRIYTNTDVAGVEVAGSIKNVIALACGICDGLELGTNAKAAILTRGLMEMTRLGVSLGGKRETFYGLSGLGDLVTTCFGPTSRNRSVGEQLGRGKSIKAVLSGMNAVAEGVITAKAVYKLSLKKNIPMPIVTEVYKILFANKSAGKAMSDLMGRSLKSE